MFTRNLCRVLLLAGLAPSAVLALGLGDIQLGSALNAPLDADIAVLGAGTEDLSGLKATVASRESFARYHLDYPAYMAGVSIEPRRGADGATVLHLHSADPISDPIATLLVEVNWARGHLVREYTLLLDPPVFSGASGAAQGVAAPLTGAATHSGAVERRAPGPAAAVAAASGGASAQGSAGGARTGAAPGGSYAVRPGDTLSSIAAQAYGPGDRVARERALVAVYRANAPAFEGNMNLLRAGSRLALPAESELTAISPGEAAAEVHRQYSSWNAKRAAGSAAGSAAGAAPSQGRLHLVPPQENTAGATAPAAGGAPQGAATAAPTAGEAAAAAATPSPALQQQVNDLRDQLAESQRLLKLKSDELAALQASSAKAPAPATTPPATATPPAAATPPAPAATAPAPAAAPAPEPAAAPAAGAAGGSWLDTLRDFWYVPVGLLAVLLAGLGLRAVRARQESAFDRSLGRLSQPGPEVKAAAEEGRGSDTVPVRALAAAPQEQSYRVEESGAHEQPAGAPRDVSASGRHVAMDESVAAETPVALDQGDPLAEADFHMAYGLYDQAADLVQIAISREPERRDLRLKLLEVFFVWGNKDRFLATAHELAASRAKALPGEWEKIVIMGRQIAPDDALFASSGALAGAASAGVDLNLEGGQNRIDFDLMGEPSVRAPEVRPGAVDLDLGAALGDTESTGEARAAGTSGVDFVFDDPGRGNEQTGSTREMPGREGASAEATAEMTAAARADPDAPTVEQLQLPGGQHPTIREKLDAATRGGMATEQTAELELHDLGLDLGSLESTGEETGLAADAPTLLAGAGEDTRELLRPSDPDPTVDAATKLAAAAPSQSGTWLFTDTDFAAAAAAATRPGIGAADAAAPTEIVTQLAPRPELEPPADAGQTARMSLRAAPELDLDLGKLGKGAELPREAAHEGEGNGVDLDLGAAAGGEGTFVQTQRIHAGATPLPELEPATMSEVGTKLDLARAYMDMGDPEGARSILTEVLDEGSASQKQEARRLIDSLPG